MEGKALRKVIRRVVKSFLDFAILAVLEENEDLNGYQVIKHIYEKLGILLPAGTIYSTLYSLEREEFIKATLHSKCRTYMLTSKGQAELEEVDKIIKAFNLFIAKLCGKNLSTQQ